MKFRVAALCLVLVALEATVGENLVSSVLFALSIPMLVTGLVWANRATLTPSRPNSRPDHTEHQASEPHHATGHSPSGWSVSAPLSAP